MAVMSVRTRLALGTLCVFNAFTVTLCGFIALFYVDGVAGPVTAGGLWLGAGSLWGLSRRLRRGTDWHWDG